MFKRLIASFALQRIAVAGLSFGAVLLAARVMPTEPYAALLQTMFLAKFLHVMNLGTVSGYFISRYAGTGALANPDPDDEARFALGLAVLLAGLGLVFVLGALFLAPGYATGGIAFLLVAPVFAVEPLFRHRRVFFASLFPDGIMAIALLVLLGVGLVLPELLAVRPFLGLMAVLSLAVLAWQARRLRAWSTTWPRQLPRPNDILNIMRIGLPVYLGTAFFMVAASMDRLLLPLRAEAGELARYFLAYQLVTGAMMFISAVNFTNVVDLGHAYERKRSVDITLILRQIRLSAVIVAVSLGLLAAGVVLLEAVFLDPDPFKGLTRITLTLGSGMAVFYWAGTITPVLGYFKRQAPMTVLMGAVSLMLLGSNLWAQSQGLGALWLANVTGPAFAIYGAIAIVFTLFVVNQSKPVKVE